MNVLFLLKRIHLELVGIRFVVAVGLESIKAELFVRARRSRGDASSLEALDQSRFQAFRLQLLIVSLLVLENALHQGWFRGMPNRYGRYWLSRQCSLPACFDIGRPPFRQMDC